MAYVTINEAYLDDMGNAIREKLGVISKTYRPKDMPAAIRSIKGSSEGEAAEIIYNIGKDVIEVSDYAFCYDDHTTGSGTCLLRLNRLSAIENTTLINIGHSAFTGQEAMTQFLNVPATLNSIGQWAFAYTGLKSIDLLNTAITGFAIDRGMGGYQFAWCSNLESVGLPKYLTHTGQGTFLKCEKLKSISLPSGLKTIGYSAFGNTGLEEIVIPASVTTIEEGAFSGCASLKTVYFEGTPNSIHNKAFYNSTAITDIYLPCSQSECPSGAPWGATNATIHYNA